MSRILSLGNLRLARLLYQEGAELRPSLSFFVPSQQSVSPLYLAVLSRSRPLVDFVLQYCIEDIDKVGPNGNRPLHNATESEALEVLATLLEHGADMCKPNMHNMLPIEHAINSPLRDRETVIRMLCKYIQPEQKFVDINQFHRYWPWMSHSQPQTLKYLKQA
jgi:ankyrin repeat protein